MESVSLATGNLSQRRRTIETQWSRFLAGSASLQGAEIREDIMSSWQRSAQCIKPRQVHIAKKLDSASSFLLIGQK